MPTPEETKRMDIQVTRLLDATNEVAALTALRQLFVEELDFNAGSGAISLSGEGLPVRAVRVASRDGVQVVEVRMEERGRVLLRHIRQALSQIQDQLGSDILLVAGSAEGGEWQLVWPSRLAGRDILRRIVVHRDQPRRTVVTQLAKVYNKARKGDIRGALDETYDVEAVTSAFFAQYRTVFQYAMGHVEGLPDEIERRLFCQTLANRLMFLYFVQRKGWMTFRGDHDYLRALLKDARSQPDENVYDARLKNLFFVGLNSPRGTNLDRARTLLESSIGIVPFLNGGLFSETPLDQRRDVVVPNDVIHALVDDLFERFNFTITESTPYDAQVAVDPEMLGKVFEELVTGRHETGSYYTPRPIVSFMCREALKGYLLTRVEGLSKEAAAHYVDEQDIHGLDRRQAEQIRDALHEFKVVDPACGSGAYLLGMMQELLECEDLLDNPGLLPSAESVYQRKLRIIERNVYGVDIDQFAINVAMLRLWLSLIVEYDAPGDPPALPNLDFKIVCGNSLAGPDPLNASGDAYRRQIHDRAPELGVLKDRYMTERGEEKNSTRTEIDTLMAHMRTFSIPYKEAPADTLDWVVQFAEVFAGGGFDAVLANPPYVRQERITASKGWLKAVYGPLYVGTADLYVFFYYRALQLLRSGGMLVFISSNKWFRAAYGAKLRQQLVGRTAIWSITDFRDLPVFQEAIAYPMIFIAQREGARVPTRYTEVPSLAAPYPDVRALIAQDGFDLSEGAIQSDQWLLADAATLTIIKQMRTGTVTLGEYVGDRIYYGVKTGFNQAFVIDGAKRDELIAADPRSAEIIKPFVVGKDIRRWVVDRKDRWLIFSRRGIDIDSYPAIEAHLEQWRAELTPKVPGTPREQPGRKPGSYQWYEIQDNVAYFPVFEGPKIVFPDIAREPRFGLDSRGAYPDCTSFLVPKGDLYLLGILNSTSVRDFFGQIGAGIQGNFLRFKEQYVQRIPIPNATSAERAAIENIVQRCLDASGGVDACGEWEAEIHSRVARLYGLDESELTTPARVESTPV